MSDHNHKHCPPETDHVPSAHSAHAHHARVGGGSLNRLTASATLHCLTGCAIGDFIGLAIGMGLDFDSHLGDMSVFPCFVDAV